MAGRTARILTRTLFALLAVVFMGAILWGVYIHLHYAYDMPNSPQPETGRVYRITVNHGFVVYVTKHDFERADFVLNKVFWVGMGCFVALACLKVYSKHL